MQIAFIYSLILSLFHPLHLSLLEVHHNPDNHSLEISQRVFVDDFEDALRDEYQTKVDVINPKDPALLQEQISGYLQKRLRIMVNDKVVSYQILGYEREEDAIWIYAEVPGAKRLRELEIESTLFHDRFTDQVNFINFTDARGELRSLRLDSENLVGTFASE